jgi:hypothetical protein
MEPRDRTVEVLERTPQGYRLVGTWGGDEGPSAMPPFEAVAVPVDALWGRTLQRTAE